MSELLLLTLLIFSWLALSGSHTFASSPKVGALGSPRKVSLFAKASPFGRGGTVGDGEGEDVDRPQRQLFFFHIFSFQNLYETRRMVAFLRQF